MSSPAPASGRPPLDPDEVPATREEVKSLRRWVLVAGVWAVAATAVALIALLDTSGGEAEKKADATAERVERVEGDVRELRSLAERVDDVESRLGGVAAAGDVTKLGSRVGRAEEDASKAVKRAGDADDAVSALEDRVQTLEDEADAAATDGGGSGGADAP